MDNVSIIIPVYNVEKYLKKCLDSVINQTYSNIEIICVNDGSTDNSREILSDYANKDKRVKIVDKKNGGLSSARNAGLDVATGEYCYFLDSDDWIELNTIESCLICMKNNSVDIVSHGIINIPEEDSCITMANDTQGWLDSFNKPDGVYDFATNINKQIPSVAWNKLYKMDIIKAYNCRFPEGLINEDELFLWEYALHCKNFYYLNDKLYNYLRRSNSIMGQRNQSAKVLDILKIQELIYLTVKKYKNIEDYKEYLADCYLSELYWLWKRIPKKYEKEALDIIKSYYININNDGRIYKEYKRLKNSTIKTIVKRIFSVKNEYTKKVIRIFGFKISFTTRKLLDKYGITELSTFENFIQLFSKNNQYKYHYHYANWHSDTIESKLKDIKDNEYFLEYNKVYPISPDAKVLEIGCGMGRFMLTLIEKGFSNVVGIDVDESQIKIAKAENLNVKKCDGLQFLKRTKEKYDVIYCIDVLEHLEKNKQIEFLKQIRRHLTDNGILVLRIPNALNPTMGKMRYEDFTHNTVYTQITIGFLLNNAGFFNFVTRQDWEESEELEKLKKPMFDIYKLQYGIEPILTPNLITVVFKSKDSFENYMKIAPKINTKYNTL